MKRTDHKVSTVPYEKDVLGMYWLSTFNLINSAQELRVQFCMRVDKKFLSITAIFTRPSGNLSDYVKRETHAHTPNTTFIIQLEMTAFDRVTPRTCACRLEMLQRETDRRKTFSPCLNLVQDDKCVWFVLIATRQMILLPSHATRCACFSINILRIMAEWHAPIVQ